MLSGRTANGALAEAETDGLLDSRLSEPYLTRQKYLSYLRKLG